MENVTVGEEGDKEKVRNYVQSLFIRRNKLRQRQQQQQEKEETEQQQEEENEEDKEKQDPTPKLPKRQRCATTEEEEEEEEEEDGTCAVVTLKDSDSDLLDCPICAEPFQSPVYQCENGHLACDSCCKEVHHKCPSCSLPVGFIRNRVVERIVKLAITSCRNRQHGCMLRLCYFEKMKHEKECQYTLGSCPSPGCQYIGVPMSFHNHFNEKHPSVIDPFNLDVLHRIYCSKDLELVFFLGERKKKLLFVVNCIMDSLGCFVRVCAPPTASEIEFSYDLSVGRRGNSIKVESDVELTPNCFVPPAKEKCLFFPVAFHAGGNSDGLILHLVIKEEKK